MSFSQGKILRAYLLSVSLPRAFQLHNSRTLQLAHMERGRLDFSIVGFYQDWLLKRNQHIKTVAFIQNAFTVCVQLLLYIWSVKWV